MHCATQHSSNRLVTEFMNSSSNPEWHEQVPVLRLNGSASFHPHGISLFLLKVIVKRLMFVLEPTKLFSTYPSLLTYTCIVFPCQGIFENS